MYTEYSILTLATYIQYLEMIMLEGAVAQDLYGMKTLKSYSGISWRH